MSSTQTAYNEQTNAASVEVEGRRYFRLGETEGATALEAPVMAQDFTSMLFEADRDLTGQEVYHLSSLIGFLWKTTVKGERLTDIIKVNSRSFVIKAALADSRSGNPYGRFDEFSEQLNDFIAEGSPVRTIGTQLVKGIEDVTLSIWLDNVSQELERSNFSKLAKLASRPSPFAPELLSGKTTEEIANKVKAMVSIKDSLTPGEQDILTMAHDLMVAHAELSAKVAEAEAKLAAVREALG